MKDFPTWFWYCLGWIFLLAFACGLAYGFFGP